MLRDLKKWTLGLICLIYGIDLVDAFILEEGSLVMIVRRNFLLHSAKVAM